MPCLPRSPERRLRQARHHDEVLRFMNPDKRPLVVGLVAASVALMLILTRPVGPLWRDAAWSLCIVIAASSIAWFERQWSKAGRPSRLLRWVAIALIVVAIAFFLMAWRATTDHIDHVPHLANAGT